MDLFNEIAEDKDDFAKFYEAFGKSLKLGIHEDAQNRSNLAEFRRFYSTKPTEEQVSLKDYITRMRAEVLKSVYYLTGDPSPLSVTHRSSHHVHPDSHSFKPFNLTEFALHPKYTLSITYVTHYHHPRDSNES